MIKGLFGSCNDPRDEKDEVEHYCKNCGMEEGAIIFGNPLIVSLKANPLLS